MKALREVLRETQLRPSRSLGQNFLHQPGVVRKILQLAEVQREDVVLEVGPGAGILTEALARVARKVWAIELDSRLARVLKEELSPFPNVEIIEADAMVYERYVPRDVNLKIVANLPYSIANPLILNWLMDGRPKELMCVMVQKEVAERMTAAVRAKEYSFLSVMCQGLSCPRIEWKVGPENFVPRPGVDSSVVVFRFPAGHTGRIRAVQDFRRIVSAAFHHRRKTLQNSLRRADPRLNLTEERISALVRAAGASALSRAQELSVEQFVEMANAYSSFP